MKKTKQYISLLLAAFMAAGLSSCIKEDYAGASDETATVNLVFDTRADNDGDGLDACGRERIARLFGRNTSARPSKDADHHGTSCGKQRFLRDCQ